MGDNNWMRNSRHLPPCSMWSSASEHLPRDDERKGDGDDSFRAFDEDEHQEPVARAAKRREITIRRHKDITQEDIDLSKKLWRWGFFLLPFLWLVNYVFFRHALTQAVAPEEMKRNIRSSLIAFCIAIGIWLVWLVVFYTNMHGWANALLLFSPNTKVFTQ